MVNDIERESTDPQGPLESALIDEFLARRGYTLHSLNRLPAGDREVLLRAAATFAALRLTEIDARAHFIDEIG